MKKRYRVGLVIVAVFAIAIAGVLIRLGVMSSRLDASFQDVADFSLEGVPDGTHSGEFKDFLVAVELTVTVAGERITEIEILRQESGPGYDAAGITDRIITEQSPRVDVISGATGSSKAIMIAVTRALSAAASR